MSGETFDEGAAERFEVSRRTIVKGAAWSVPAIMVAGQAPAMAVASPPVIIVYGESTACKIPGESWRSLCYNKGYVLWAKFVNESTVPVYVTVTGINVGGVNQCLIGVTDPSLPCPTGPVSVGCFMIPAGGSKSYGIFSNASTDSSSTTVTVTYSYSTVSCGDPAATSIATTGNVIGEPWTPGGGSCKFPSGTQCFTPLKACGATGPYCAGP